MKMADVKTKAKSLGITSGRMKKIDLIHSIQQTEGNVQCFQTGLVECDQYGCCWRDECMNDK